MKLRAPAGLDLCGGPALFALTAAPPLRQFRRVAPKDVPAVGSYLRISRSILRSATRGATICSNHSSSTQSQKRRCPASSTQFTFCHERCVHHRQGLMRASVRPTLIRKAQEVGLIDDGT
jgi:hypothetical protein